MSQRYNLLFVSSDITLDQVTPSDIKYVLYYVLDGLMHIGLPDIHMHPKPTIRMMNRDEYNETFRDDNFDQYVGMIERIVPN
jgi:hypothetical protein